MTLKPELFVLAQMGILQRLSLLPKQRRDRPISTVRRELVL